MRRNRVAATAVATLMGTALALPLTTTGALANPSSPSSPSGAVAGKDAPSPGSDSLTPAWREKFEARTKAALEQRLRTGGKGDAERLGKGVFGRVEQTGTDKIFVVLAEFGDTTHSAYPDGDSDATRVDGPLHNEIPKPDRSKNNHTLWKKNYARKHYQNIYFNRMDNFYRNQSSGKYSIDGNVTAWVRVPFNEARYGRDVCGGIVCNNTWFLIRDALAQWTQDRLDAGWSMTRITNYLKTFDHQDRYDFDGDGDFNEPDGYIDHFQIVHAGGDQADGDPIYGEDAIWSHRWNAQIEPFGTGPVGGAPIGGVNVGEGGVSDANGANVAIPDNPTGVWVNDYTIQPENGGLSVFAHEFGHDLGLPDLYDTSGNTGGAENSTGFWSLMSQSRGTAKGDPGIGDRPMPFGAWEKFSLGWLDYDVARAGRTSTHVLRPAQKSSATRGRNGLIVLLPDKNVPLELGAPCADCGDRFFYSDSGDELDNTMTRSVDDGGDLSATVRYDIEPGWDYAFLEASSDGGDTWTSLPTNQSYDGDDESGLDPTDTGISGSSGGWVNLTATVPGGTDAVRWHYVTDTAATYPGFQVDNITLDGTDIGNAETDDEGWDFNGFRTTTGTEDQSFLNAYIVDNRQHVGRDRILDHVYSFKNSSKVEFFSYQPGALVTYWDTSYGDNNVGEHPGGGQILPVDAHPVFAHTPDGALARPRSLSFDSTFSTKRVEAQVLHQFGERYTLPGSRAENVFDDTLDWWFDSDEHGLGTHEGRYQPGWYGVDVPKTGTTIKVAKVTKKGIMKVKVGTSN